MRKTAFALLAIGALALFTYVGLTPAANAAATTDARVKYVVSDGPYTVDVSTSAPRTVRVGIQNVGPIVADLSVVLLLTSQVGVCEAHWVPQAGDGFVEDNMAGTLRSELDITLPVMLPGEAREIVRTYMVHCFAKSFHDNAVRFEVGVVPVLPIGESNPADNTYLEQIDITALARADVQDLGFVINPVGLTVGQSSPVVVRSVLHNFGPFGPVTALSNVTPSVPGDCTAVPPAYSGTPVVLPVSVTVSLDQTFSFTCSQPSLHSICWTGSISAQTLHLSDPNASNNSAALCVAHPVAGTTDVKMTSLTVDSPAAVAPGQSFSVTAIGVVHNNGPYGPANASGNFSLALPSGCSSIPSGAQSYGPISLAVSAPSQVARAWTVTCPLVGTYVFTGTATTALVPLLHLSDSNASNNSATATTTTVVSTSVQPPHVPPLAIGGSAGLLPPSAASSNASAVAATASAACVLLIGAVLLRRRRT